VPLVHRLPTISRTADTQRSRFDRFAAPSKDAAATDLNKIFRFDYPNPLYSKLGLEAMKIWETPGNLFHGLFRRTGWIMGAHEMTAGLLQSAYETSKEAGRKGVKFIDITEMKRMFPQFTSSFSGWTNLWSPQAGWV
jgi:sarcosine oxidase/L-pipecolate oxidase